jgi:hypothetical protein
MKYFNRTWKHSFLLSACICAAAAYLAPTVARLQQVQEDQARRGRVDWIFVLDTSASMKGTGGTSDIFDKVKSTLETLINSAEEGDSVTIYTFDRDTTTRPTVRISDPVADKRDLRNTIRNLNATGDRTHTGKAIRDALDRAQELRGRGIAERRTPSIVLLTDGIQDVRGVPNPVSIPSNVELIPNSKPYIFLVSLGREHDLQLDEFVNDPVHEGRSKVLRDPNAENIENLAETIRAPVEAAAAEPSPTPVPTPISITIGVEPINLNFGQIKPGRQTGRETLNLTSDTDLAVQLMLDGDVTGISIVEPSGPVALKAGESTAVRVRLAAADNAADGARTFLIKVNVRDDTGRLPSDAIIKAAWSEARLTVKRVPFLRTLLWWLAVVLVLLLIALIIYCAYKGTTPLALRDEFVGRRLLEGELEVLRPKPTQAEQAFVNLNGLRLRRLALSQVVPDGAAGMDEAELETAYANGVKVVRLQSRRGEVRVNDAPVNFTSLYDGDTIELGQARLRFNWVDHERPVETADDLA